MITLSLVTPLKKVVSNIQVSELYVPAWKGELNILPGHAPLISLLSTGTLRYRDEKSGLYHLMAISWGYLEVFNDTATVLAETAESSEEIDLDRAKKSKALAERELLRGDVEHSHFIKYQLKLQRAMVRVQTKDKN